MSARAKKAAAQPAPRVRAPRTCGRCGRAYYRSNRFRLWTQRNPGRRVGWQKVEEPVCNDCLPVASAAKILVITAMRVARGVRERA